MCSCISGHFSNAVRTLKAFFYTVAAERASLSASARLNLGVEFRLGDSCTGGMLLSGNRGAQETSQVLLILEDGGKASSSAKEA